MAADALKEAISLIKTGRMNEARMILEPIIIANPQNIQAWVWEIETREDDEDKIKIMDSCLQHNPDSTLILNARAVLKKRMQLRAEQTKTAVYEEKKLTEFITPFTENITTPELRLTDEKFVDETVFSGEVDFSKPIESIGQSEIDTNEVKKGETAPLKNQININPPFEGFGATSDEKYITVEPCPYCGELIKVGAEVCVVCGHGLTHAVIPVDDSVTVSEVMAISDESVDWRVQKTPKLNIQATMDGFKASEKEKRVIVEPCPYCGELIRQGSAVCDECGRELIRSEKIEDNSAVLSDEIQAIDEPEEERKTRFPQIDINAPFEGFSAADDETSVNVEPCPHCGELIREGSTVCEVCGQEINREKEDSEEPKKESGIKTKWYRRTWVKILFFIFLMPVWSILELSDPESKTSIKVLASIIIGFFVTLCSLLFYWFLTTNSSRANLLNIYRSLTGQSQITPGTVIRVEGNVQNSGNTDFGLVELQARVYDNDGNLLGISRQYMGSSILLPGDPTRFQLDVTPLLSPLSSGLIDQRVLLYDDFSSSTGGWNKEAADEGATTYKDGQFEISVNEENYDLWSNPGESFEDVKIEIDVTKQNGPDNNRMGLQCRYQDPDNYYFALISSDGYYGIGKVFDGAQTILPENGMQATQTIFAGQAINHIRFDCVGTKLTLYVNGDYVDSVDDSDLSVGDIGLLAGTFDEKGVTISFDNLLVLSP